MPMQLGHCCSTSNAPAFSDLFASGPSGDFAGCCSGSGRLFDRPFPAIPCGCGGFHPMGGSPNSQGRPGTQAGGSGGPGSGFPFGGPDGGAQNLNVRELLDLLRSMLDDCECDHQPTLPPMPSTPPTGGPSGGNLGGEGEGPGECGGGDMGGHDCCGPSDCGDGPSGGDGPGGGEGGDGPGGDCGDAGGDCGSDSGGDCV